MPAGGRCPGCHLRLCTAALSQLLCAITTTWQGSDPSPASVSGCARLQVFFSSSTMKDIIAPAAAQAASKKDPVRGGS